MPPRQPFAPGFSIFSATAWRRASPHWQGQTWPTLCTSSAKDSPWANLKKASRSWLLFQIERAKVWSPRWVENDKRKGFGGVVENCGVQTLSKNRFFWSVRQGRRSSMRLTPFVSISLWFTADSFVILAADVGTWPRWPSLLVKHRSVRVVARKYSGLSRVAEGHFGVLKCAYGSHEEFLVLLIFRVLIIRSDENRVSMLFGHTLAPLVFGRHHH